jgi:hypothetical protein
VHPLRSASSHNRHAMAAYRVAGTGCALELWQGRGITMLNRRRQDPRTDVSTIHGAKCVPCRFLPAAPHATCVQSRLATNQPRLAMLSDLPLRPPRSAVIMRTHPPAPNGSCPHPHKPRPIALIQSPLPERVKHCLPGVARSLVHLARSEQGAHSSDDLHAAAVSRRCTASRDYTSPQLQPAQHTLLPR